MIDEIDKAILYLAKKIQERNIQSDNTMKLSQAILNLAHAKDQLVATDRTAQMLLDIDENN